MDGKIQRWDLAFALAVVLGSSVMVGGAMADPAATSESEEYAPQEMDTVGGHLKATRRPEPNEMDRHTFYLNGAEFYHANEWGMSLKEKFRIGNTDVVIVGFITGGNSPCIDRYSVLGVRPNKTAYWIKEDIFYCNATFAVVGDKLVMTDTVADGRRTRTEKTIISLDGAISHAR